MEIYTIFFIILAYSILAILTFVILGRDYYEDYAITKDNLLDTVRDFLYVNKVGLVASVLWPITWLAYFIVWLVYKKRKS